jgi:pimeloyl-ACP methyl ester carboxylesterase
VIELHNGRVALALHALDGTAPALRGGASVEAADGLPLLLLHELGGAANDFRAEPLPWPGPVHALDFSGHGHSGRVYGGGYYPELWAADADIALAALGEAVVLGAGLGAYVALLLAGGRPALVRCAVLCPGTGLFGGGSTPRFPPDVLPPDIETTTRAQALQAASSPDPTALIGQGVYVRPPDYAARFAAAARRIVLLEDADARPAWWSAVRETAGVLRCQGSPETALAMARTEP